MTRLSYPAADTLAVDGVALYPGSYISESRKRLPCECCGTIFESNREFFVAYTRVLRNTPKSGRYCLDCAAHVLANACPVR